MALRMDDTVRNGTAVVKFLRPYKGYYEEPLEKHRLDANVMERLTARPDIPNAYAYCGNSVVSEYLSGGSLRDLIKDEERRSSLNARQRLTLAGDVATALATLHTIPPSDDGRRATVTHGDFQVKNILLDENGKIKLNDFNKAKVIYYDPSTGQPCRRRYRRSSGILNPGFPPPERRAKPEDGNVLAPDKLDVYYLGMVFHEILTGQIHRDDHEQEVVNRVELQFFHPDVADNSVRHLMNLTTDVLETNDLLEQGFIYALLACLVASPEHRPSSVHIASAIKTVMEWDEHGIKNKSRRDVQQLFESSGVQMFK